MVKRIDKLTDAQRARFDEWADRWIEIGLRTGPADRERMEAALGKAYGYAGLPWHGNVVWVSSPIVMSIAAPTAAFVCELRKNRVAVRDAVDGAVRGAVGGAVRVAIDDAVQRAVLQAISNGWHRYMGGQFWVGGWGWGGAWTSYFREVAGLELPGGLWDQALTYEATLESACWWWPHRDFVMVCERPVEIHRELADPSRTRGWGSHRLHREDGPAVAWPDGWGVYALHGVRVPADLIEHGWSTERILREENQEIRRVAIERLGWDHFVDDAQLALVNEDDDPANPGRRLKLYDVPEHIYGEPVRVLLCVNGTQERDGTWRKFGLTVPGDVPDAVSAAAWTYDLDRETYNQLERRT